MFAPGKSFTCVSGIPEGAKFVGLGTDVETNNWVICVEHESFPLVDPGVVIPIIEDPVFRSIRPLEERLKAFREAHELADVKNQANGLWSNREGYRSALVKLMEATEAAIQ